MILPNSANNYIKDATKYIKYKHITHKDKDKTLSNISKKNYSNFLPEVYQGAPFRLERYRQYEMMESDSEISAGLDILADFCTQNNEQTRGVPFRLEFETSVSQQLKDIIIEMMYKWCNLQDWEIRIHNTVRTALKFGDKVFIRDPETLILYDVDPYNVDKVAVNEAKGKIPEIYYIRNVDLNLKTKNITKTVDNTNGYPINGISATVGPYNQSNLNTGFNQGSNVATGVPFTSPSANTRFDSSMNVYPVDATHIVHLSLNTGIGPTWPFGVSVLENIFKIYKQKELIEDAILIYRIQRAPERRIFKIDVGTLPPHKAMQYITRFKNEIHQRRIPSRDGEGSNNLMDTVYNPLSTCEDYYFPVSAQGKGSDVSTLPGGSNLGEIDDLKYWNNKLIRGLKIPTTYLPYAPDTGDGANYNDGRIGQVLVQEIRFFMYCSRIQSILIKKLDEEFKLYLKLKRFTFDSSEFKLRFNPPMNFASWTKMELLSNRMQMFDQAISSGKFSVKFAMQYLLGLTEEEINKNETMLLKEKFTQIPKEQQEQIMDQFTGENIPDIKSIGMTNQDIGLNDEFEEPDMEDIDLEEPEMKEPTSEESETENIETDIETEAE